MSSVTSLPIAALVLWTSAAPTPARDVIDERELQAMRSTQPHAVELLEQGEAKASAGSLAEAESLFRQAHAEYPDGAILWRRDCEMLAALGRRPEAIQACTSAMSQAHTNTNFRALASSFVDGPAPPSAADLTLAILVTAAERHRGLSPAVAAAACDIAERIGDIAMLQRCTEDLERLDPGDPATQKAERILASRCPPWRFWLGWGAIAAALGGTLGHAVARFVRRKSRRTGAVAVVGVALVLSMARIAGADEPAPAPAPAAAAPAPSASASQWLSKWAVDDAHPDSNIPSEKDRNADPLQFGYWIQDVALKGEHASKRGDHVAAAKLYEALAVAVPDRATGFLKACEEYEAAGMFDKAINACADGLLRDGLMAKDYIHFVHLVVSRPGKLGDKETAALANVLAHMREDPAGKPFVDGLECEVGSRTSNVAQLKECTNALAARAPDDAKTIVYQWDLAVAEGNAGEAEELMRRGRAAGVSSEDGANMKAATDRMAMDRAVRTTLITVAVGLVVSALYLALTALSRRKRLATDVTTTTTPSGEAT